MALTCSACGVENPPGARFCNNCGTALGSTIEERKTVTILFADVVGSTHLSGSVDPERLRAQMGRFFALAREEIERYGGTVEKFIGDAVMAVFGLPVIHENDPERAARAAVAIRERARPLSNAGELSQIRIGLTTGEVVANPQASDKGEFLVTGEAVNLAARLQQHAEPGQVLAGERTMLALRGIATLRAVPPLNVKGPAEPLPAWLLLDVAPPRERELRETPFVGREEELALLEGLVRRMRREGRGHVATILGPAGVGKTRLVAEFRQRIVDVHTLRGRAIPYGPGVPFWSLAEAIREECGVLFGDPLDVARRKVEETAARLDVADAVPALLPVLGLGGGGRDLAREELFKGIRNFFEALARRAPLLLILEDMHSAEDVTLDVLEQAADRIREIAGLILVLGRPELLERRPTWMGGKRSATALFLDPLTGEDSRVLAEAILGGKAAPPALVDLVLTRAEGNPLFMEEMLRVLIERGTLVLVGDHWTLGAPLEQVSIPDTVQAVIGARVDALPSREKQTLQAAAVQGKDFYLGALRLVANGEKVDEPLRALIEKELLVPKPRSTVLGEEEFTFRHILIRDVAYAMIPKARRLTQHARVAEWTERMAADRPAEWADYVAHHWLQVVALGQELGLTPNAHARAQAVANLLLAGERAASVYANTTALDHFTRVLDLDPEVDARLRALLGRGQVWFLLGQYDQARADFGSVHDLARETGQRRWEAVALDKMGYSFRQQDQVAVALQHLQAALALSRNVEDHRLAGHILNHIGFTYFAGDRHRESTRAHEEAREILQANRDEEGLAESLHGQGDSLMFLGRFQEALQVYQRSLALSDQVGNRSLAAENRYMLSFARHKLGEYAAAQTEAERSVATLTEIGDSRNLSPALFCAALIAWTQGDFGRALALADRGITVADQIGAIRIAIYPRLVVARVHRELEDYQGALGVDRQAAKLARPAKGTWLPVVLASLALDEAALGRGEEAEKLLDEARRAMEDTETRLDFAQEVTHAEGQVHLLLGRPAEARTAAADLLALVASTGTLHWRVPALLLGAEAAAAIGDHEAAMRQYTQAMEESERSGRLPAWWRALGGLAEIHRAQQCVAEAVALAARSREIIEGLAATVADERLRAVFLQSARVQRVFALAGA